MLRISIEDDRVATTSNAASSAQLAAPLDAGRAPIHLLRAHTASAPVPVPPGAVLDAGRPPAWLTDAVRGLVSQSARHTARPNA